MTGAGLQTAARTGTPVVKMEHDNARNTGRRGPFSWRAIVYLIVAAGALFFVWKNQAPPGPEAPPDRTIDVRMDEPAPIRDVPGRTLILSNGTGDSAPDAGAPAEGTDGDGPATP